MTGEDCIMRSFLIFKLQQISFWLQNGGELNGRVM